MKTVCSRHSQAYEVSDGCPYCVPVAAAPAAPSYKWNWEAFCKYPPLPYPYGVWIHSAPIGGYRTSFVMNFALQMAVLHRRNTLYVSAEMGYEVIKDRFEYIHGDSSLWADPKMGRLIFSDSATPGDFTEVLSEANSIQKSINLDMIVIDGLDLFCRPTPTGKLNQIRKVVELANTFNGNGIHVLATVTPDRQGYIDPHFRHAASMVTQTQSIPHGKALLRCTKSAHADTLKDIVIDVDRPSLKFS